jgi:hypothetical protein
MLIAVIWIVGALKLHGSCPVTGKQEVILLERKLVLQTGWMGVIGEIRVPPPENLLVKWRIHAGCGLNLSTVCFL